MTLCRCQAYLDQLLENHPDIVTRECLGTSIQGRNLDMVTITRQEEIKEEEEGREVKKRTILVMARLHPGESPASYVVQGMPPHEETRSRIFVFISGLMDFLVSKHKIAAELREKLIFKVSLSLSSSIVRTHLILMLKVIPMMNPDGVYLGNYRGNLLGIDLNRIWDNCSPHAHPTAAAVKKLIEELSRSDQTLDFVLDIHVSNTMLGFFVVGNAYDRSGYFYIEKHLLI